MKNTFRFLLAAFAATCILLMPGCGGSDDNDDPVTIAVTGISVTPATLDLAVGDAPAKLTATVFPAEATDKSVSWKSSDTGVATVSNGTVTAVAPGTASITATTTDGAKTASCTVTVTSVPDASISVSFINLPPVNEPRNGPVLIVNGNEDFVVLGGHTTGFSLCNTVEAYRGENWVEIATDIRHDLGSQTMLQDGKTLIAGGCSSGGGSGNSDVAHIYDPAARSISAVGSMTTARTWNQGALLKNGKSLICGNWYATAMTLDLFDPNTREFTMAGELTSSIRHSPLIFPTADGGAILVNDRTNGAVVSYAADGTVSDLVVESLKGLRPQNVYGSPTHNMESMLTADGRYLFVAQRQEDEMPFVIVAFNPADASFSEEMVLPALSIPGHDYTYTNELFINPSRNLAYIFGYASPQDCVLRIINLKTKQVLHDEVISRSIAQSGIRMLPNGNLLVVGGTSDGSNYDALTQAFIIKLF